jgi:hypothetical protein
MRFLTGTANPRVALAATLLGAALVAGCDATGTPGASGSASPSSAPQPSASAVSLSPEVAANTQTVCADVKKIITDNTVEFSKRIVAAVSAAQSDDTRAVAAIKEVKSLLADWAAGLRTQADKALQPDLKAALSTEAASFETAATKINTTEDLKNAGNLLSGDAVAQAGQMVQEACGSYWAR